MASLSASYSFASGDTVTIMIDIENDYPDAMAEAVKATKDALREALAVVAELEDDEDE